MCCSCGPNILMYYVLPFLSFLIACLQLHSLLSLYSHFHLLTKHISFSLNLGIKEHKNMDPNKYLQGSYSSSSGLTNKGPVKQKMAEDEYGDDVEIEGEEEDQEKSGRALEKKKKSSLFVVDKKGSGSSGGGTATWSCQVENCEADLTDSKKYHKRHKVCEIHAKAPVVVVAGSRQRFCQQCSRFHVLTEFDDTKRSCRRRLAGHNERRRKSSSESRGESSSRRGPSQYEKENQCRLVDGGGISLSNSHIH